MYSSLGNIYSEEDNLDEAIRMYEKALKIMKRIGDEPGVTRQYGNLAICYQQKGRVALALEFYRKSLDIMEAIGDRHGAAVLYFDIGTLYRDEIGNNDEARAHIEKAKALFEMVGDEQGAQKAAKALRDI